MLGLILRNFFETLKVQSGLLFPNKAIKTLVVFVNGLDWKKWIDTVADLIDMRKKVRIFCIEK
jgi:hypothetical protein